MSGFAVQNSGGGAPRIRVVVADDSAVMRRAITHILESESDIEVVGTARNGIEAVELTRALRPDAVTMDVNMPKMDGLQALEEIMGHNPTPVVLLSAFAQPGGKVVQRALACGAVHIVQKPSEYGISLDLDRQADEIRRKVRSASRIRVVRNAAYGIDPARQVLLGSRARPNLRLLPSSVQEGMPIVAVGASTGGVEVLGEILPQLPADFPACVLIVQHCPPGYTTGWAKSLDAASAVSVLEARHGDFLRPGKVFIAPGGHHMEVCGEQIRLSAGPRVKMHRPSVDVLFDSLRPAARRVFAVLLTGMGDDGVAAMMRLHAAGATTVAQSRASCSMWAMPGAAVRAGCVDAQLPPDDLIPYLMLKMERMVRGTGMAVTHGR